MKGFFCCVRVISFMLWLGILLGLSFALLALWLINLTIKKNATANKIFKKLFDWNGSRKILKRMFAILAILGLFTGMMNLGTRMAYIQPESTINGTSKWVKSGSQQYLLVEAEDRYSLGYLEGQGIAKQIVNLRTIIQFAGISLNKPYWTMINDAKPYDAFIPAEYKEEMRGMANGASQGSGCIITYNDILVQNCFLDLSYGKYGPEGAALESIGCSALGAENSDGTTMIGQNFDFPKMMDTDYLPSLSFVLTKFPGVADIFSMRMGAQLSLPIGKTSNGITSCLTALQSNIISNISMPAVVLARQGFEKATSVVEIHQMVYENNYQTAGWTTLVTDGTQIIGTQCHPLDYRYNFNTTIVNTNMFNYPDWDETYGAYGDFSKTRQKYVERLLDERYSPDNKLTEEEVIEILGIDEDSEIEGLDSAPLKYGKMTEGATIAVFTSNSFGLGNVNDGLGTIPI